MLSESVQPPGFSMHRANREFSSVIVTAVYIPPQADTKTAIKELHWTICKLETIHPQAPFIVAGDFNNANLRTSLPKFFQHIDCAVRMCKTLDHWYSKGIQSSPFGKSNHDDACSFRLIGRNSNMMHHWLEPFNAGPTNRKPRFNIVLITRTGICSRQPQRTTSTYTLTLWVSLQRSALDMLYPLWLFKPNPNQKSRMDGGICAKLKARFTAFNHGKWSGKMSEYKHCS